MKAFSVITNLRMNLFEALPGGRTTAQPAAAWSVSTLSTHCSRPPAASLAQRTVSRVR